MKLHRALCIAIVAAFISGCSSGGSAPAPSSVGTNSSALSRSLSASTINASSSFKTIYRFGNASSGGGNPFSGVIYENGVFYGTTVGFGGPGDISECGSVYMLTPNQSFSVFKATFLHHFSGSDGCNPIGHLIRVGSALYGATEHGGAYGGGTVFSIATNGGPLAVLYSFSCGTDGCNPEGPVLNVGSNLYGTTFSGGSANCSGGCGTVFSVPMTGGADSILYSFTGSPDGAAPTGGVTNVGANLYGTTSTGGANNLGTVYGVAFTGGPEVLNYPFAGGPADGANPSGYGRLLNISSNLYGTTTGGGVSGNGTVFRLPVSGGPITLLYSFAGGVDGATPEAPVHLINSTLYGTTNRDGLYGVGTLYSLPLAGGADTVLHQFELVDHQGGYGRNSGLSSIGNTLYGTTQVSGQRTIYGYGTVFAQAVQ